MSEISELEILDTSSISTYHPTDNETVGLNSYLTTPVSTMFVRQITEEMREDSDNDIKELLYEIFENAKIVDVIYSFYI